jgi:hypothetical protein
VVRLGRIAFTDDMQFFPKVQALVGEHLHKTLESPIIIYHAIAYVSLAPFFAGLALLLFDDHLPKGAIANYHGPFSQCASDKMGGLVQIVLLLAALLLSNALVDTREMAVAARLFLFRVFQQTENLVRRRDLPAQTHKENFSGEQNGGKL